MVIDKNNPPLFIEFNEKRYRLMGRKRRYYLQHETTSAKRKNVKGLHVAIWELHNNKTCPPKHHIHHKDGDTFNNSPDNLECLPADVHYRQSKNMDREKNRKHLESIRPMASVWHGSKQGLEHHKVIGKISWSKKQQVNQTCIVCSKQYPTWMVWSKFCSDACERKQYIRSKRKIITCVICGIESNVYKYSKSEACPNIICRKELGRRRKASL